LKPAAFAYAKARSVEHAIDLLRQDGARVLAGGQSLVATLNMRLGGATLLVDINEIAGLDRIALDDGVLEIGALTRQVQAERSDLVARHAPLIARALPHIGHSAIRNRGTIGGSIALADPAAELPACLVALAGEVVLAGPDGRRSVAAEKFFTGLYETAFGRSDVLVAIRVPERRRKRASASPSWRGDTAITRWSDWRRAPARLPDGCATCAWFSSASTRSRDAPMAPRRRLRQAISTGRWRRSISIRLTICRRPAP
jgi:CO/xanthine dehydrogenase FAD-binding subunit